VTTNVLLETSPYYFMPLGASLGDGWWKWDQVVSILRSYEQTGMVQPQLPRAIQRPGALLGLTIGLGFRQAALTAML
jgi:hypothetical protein